MTSIEKAQWVRLLDVFAIGPAVIYYGRTVPDPLGRLALVAIGVGTIVYNGRNWLANRRPIPLVEPSTVPSTVSLP